MLSLGRESLSRKRRSHLLWLSFDTAHTGIPKCKAAVAHVGVQCIRNEAGKQVVAADSQREVDGNARVRGATLTEGTKSAEWCWSQPASFETVLYRKTLRNLFATYGRVRISCGMIKYTSQSENA